MILNYPSDVKTEKEKLDYIVKNEDLIFDQAKTMFKKADGFGGAVTVLRDMNTTKAVKAEDLLEKDSIEAKLAINTTNVLDSHGDLHLNGMWDKSIKETGSRVLHLQEHKRTFKDTIARGKNLKVYTETVAWKDLGFKMDGETEVLTFDSNILKSENDYMFGEYAKGNVSEHSVGMMYVKMTTCINDEDYPVQKENWDKYAPMVANKSALKSTNVFWAVSEAKVIEGSAVPLGSNSFTPTVSIKEIEVTDHVDLTDEQIKENATKAWLNIK